MILTHGRPPQKLVDTLNAASLTPYLSRQQVDDLKSVLDDADSHQLLAIVAAVHHHGVGQTLHNGALGLAETLGGITSSRVWQVLGVFLFHGNVILWGKRADVIRCKSKRTKHIEGYHVEKECA